MAVYRTISMSFWTDPKVEDDFTPEDKYFYLYLMTNPQTNLAGCYEASLKTMAEQTGYNKDTIERLLTRFSEVHNVLRYSKTTKEVYLLNWSKHNWTKSSKLDKPLLQQIKQIKNRVFRDELLNLYSTRDSVVVDDLQIEDTVSIPYLYPMDTTVTVTNTNIIYKLLNNIKDNYILSDSILDVIKQWLEYKKTSKKFTYQETGLKSLLKQISEAEQEYGTEAIATVIQQSMGNGYQGIVFDSLKKYPKKPQSTVSETTNNQLKALQEAREKRNAELLARMMAEEGGADDGK